MRERWSWRKCRGWVKGDCVVWLVCGRGREEVGRMRVGWGERARGVVERGRRAVVNRCLRRVSGHGT